MLNLQHLHSLAKVPCQVDNQSLNYLEQDMVRIREYTTWEGLAVQILTMAHTSSELSEWSTSAMALTECSFVLSFKVNLTHIVKPLDIR